MTTEELITIEPRMIESLASVKVREKAARTARLDAEERTLVALVALLQPILPLNLREAPDSANTFYLALVRGDGTFEFHDLAFHGHDDDFECGCDDDVIVEQDDDGHWVARWRTHLTARQVLGHVGLGEIVAKIGRVLAASTAKREANITVHETARAVAQAMTAAISA